MAQIVFTTCQTWPTMSESDGYVARALEARGHTVTAVPWNGDFAAFRRADLIILRSHWDYHLDMPRFNAWLDAVVAYQLPMQNPIPMVRWNLHKGYLLALAKQGVTVPPSAVYRQGMALEAIYEAHGWREAVIKPVYGASGHLVERVAQDEIPAWVANHATSGGEWLVQQFMPEVQDHGELSIILFHGEYSHAIAKQPQPGEFRVNSQYYGQLRRIEPEADVVAQAQGVLMTLAELPLYARVDGVVTAANTFCLLELELNEPGLYFPYAPEQAHRFAEAIDRHLHDTANAR